MNSGLGKYLDDLYSCVRSNHSVLMEILNNAEVDLDSFEEGKTLALDHKRLISCLFQIVREWTIEPERKKCFEAILEELKNQHPDEDSRSEIIVVIPGKV